jgi:selenocysteine-specific translation elongation factor
MHPNVLSQVRLQTEESIGIVEELGIPAVVCLNKVDKLSKKLYPTRIQELTNEIRSYTALENAEVFPISAKTGLFT